jgi:hypothetical protein
VCLGVEFKAEGTEIARADGPRHHGFANRAQRLDPTMGQRGGNVLNEVCYWRARSSAAKAIRMTGRALRPASGASGDEELLHVGTTEQMRPLVSERW